MTVKQPIRAKNDKLSAATIPRVIKAMWEHPRTIRDLSRATNTGYDGILTFVKSMHKEGLIHIVDWRHDAQKPVAVYAFGPGKDATQQWTGTERRIMELFGDQSLSMTSEEIGERVGINRCTISKSMNRLMVEGLMIRNPRQGPNDPVSWRRNLRMQLPAFGAHVLHYALQTAPSKGPVKLAPQTWFSAIA
jgi:hypothetical protein